MCAVYRRAHERKLGRNSGGGIFSPPRKVDVASSCRDETVGETRIGIDANARTNGEESSQCDCGRGTALHGAEVGVRVN